MYLEAFLISIALFFLFFWLAFKSKDHIIGLIMGMLLFMIALSLFLSPLQIQTGYTTVTCPIECNESYEYGNGTEAVTTYNYSDGFVLGSYMIAIFLLCLAIYIMFRESFSISV